MKKKTAQTAVHRKDGDPRSPIVIVTGLSGSGLSTAIDTLQDSGFYCVDNLPIELLWDAISLVESGTISARGFAFGMDIRDTRFAVDFPQLKDSLSQRSKLDVLFIEADPLTIAKRYSATRRRHPLLSESADLGDAIAREMTLLEPVRAAADGVIDTSHLTPGALARVVEERYAEGSTALRTLFVTIASFGFKYGQLAPAESIHDIRYLPNPYFDPELKHKTGLDRDVQDFVLRDAVAKETFTRLEDLYRFLLPLYYREGKHFLRVGIGCTGGQHRSVTFVEKLAASLREHPLPNVMISVVHRDLEE